MLETSLQSTRALYYPHVEFASTAWVKSALLFWEGLVRARSRESSPNDDREVQELIAAGLIDEIAPVPLRQQVLPHIGRRLEELISSRGGRLPAGIPAVRSIRGVPPERQKQDRAEVVDLLRDYPLAERAFQESPDQATTLLFALAAERVAHERWFDPVTDDPIFAAISQYFATDELTDDPGRASSPDWREIALVCLPAPSLEAIAQLSVKRLLEIRKTYAAQRRHFRRTVQARVSQIVQLQSRDAVEENLKSLREEIRDDLEATRAALREAKTRERWSLLAVGVPMSISIGAAVTSGASAMFAAIEGGGALGLGITRWFTQRRLTKAGPESPYLLVLDGALRRPWQQLGHALKDLVHG